MNGKFVSEYASISAAKAPVVKRPIPGLSGILPRLPENLSAELFTDAACRHLNAGEALFLAGDGGSGCYVLKQGLLKVIVSSPQGEERILAILGPDTIVGELSVIDGQPRSASVFAIEKCELNFISQAVFTECARLHPEIYQYLVEVLAARLRETGEIVAADTFLSVESRLARAVLQLAKLLGEEETPGLIVIRHKIGQNDLAAMAGVARENVSRALCDWKRRKLVTRSTGYYCIHDIAALRRLFDSR